MYMYVFDVHMYMYMYDTLVHVRMYAASVTLYKAFEACPPCPHWPFFKGGTWAPPAPPPLHSLIVIITCTCSTCLVEGLQHVINSSKSRGLPYQHRVHHVLVVISSNSSGLIDIVSSGDSEGRREARRHREGGVEGLCGGREGGTEKNIWTKCTQSTLQPFR